MIEHSLKEKYPMLAKEWHPTKNGALTPDAVLSKSNKKVWWLCPKNSEHVFFQRISYHVKSKKCPMCTGKKVANSNSLATLFPDVAKEWHPIKNGTLTPNDVASKSQIEVWWQCPVNKSHVYQSRIDQRTRRQSKCPICQNKKIVFENSLEGLRPDLLSEWDYVKNIGIFPSEVGLGSSKKVWWKCKENHSWRTVVYYRVKGSNCPKCNKSIPHKLPTLDIANPELVLEWNAIRNKSKKPADFTAGSNAKVWWICLKCNHEWQAVINNRARRGRGCPNCYEKGIDNAKTLSISFPDIANEWHPSLNKPLTPENVSYGSAKIVWWQCSKVKEHVWKDVVKNRTSATPSKCPYCEEVFSKSFVDEFPEIAKEWHPTKNIDLKPSDVPPQSNKKVWWLCSNNPTHEWEAVIKNRTILKSGCRYCHSERANLATTKDLIDAIISSSEFYDNYKNGIDSIIKLLNVKIWDRKLNRAFRKMIYANVITLMEAYLSDTFIKILFKDTDLQKKFIESNPRYQKEKIEISNIYSWFSNIEKNIKDELTDITYHNVWKVQNMYKDVLGIEFPENLKEVQDIIQIRHDLVHRDGKTKDGKIINVSIPDLKKAIDCINKFIIFIEEQFTNKFHN